MKITEILNEDWNKVNKQDKTDGLSQKAVNAYRRENPGSKLKTAVTTKPSKLKAGSKDANRRKSFCARMSGNKGPMKKPNGKPTPKALALRRWNCESVEEMRELIEHAEKVINETKQRLDPKCWKGKHKEGTKIKGGVRVNNCVPNESVNEMDKGSPQPGRDGRVSHSTYGSRDKQDKASGPERYVKVAKPKDVVKSGAKALDKAFKGVAEGSTNKDMTGQTCEKCKKGKYQERSQYDDMEGKVTCRCGHRVDRWKNYKEQGVAEGEVVAFPKKHKSDLSKVHSCVKCGGDLQGGKYMGHAVKVCMPCKQVYLPPNSGIDQKGDKIKEGMDKDRCPQCGMKDCTCAPGKCKCKPVAGWVPNKGFQKAREQK